MKVYAYLHPKRCLQPCGGVGRHAIELLSRLAQIPDILVEVLAARGELTPAWRERCPLHKLPTHSHPFPELGAERLWKTVGWPSLDPWTRGADWVFSPMETYLPVRNAPVAITIHDIQCFEPNLPWSHTTEHKTRRAKWGIWVKKALRDCRFVCTVSEFTKRRMVELLDADPDKIVVTGNGVDERFFTLPLSIAPTSSPYILVVGGLRYKKGADHVLAVARELKHQGNLLRIAVAGQNEPGYTAQAQAAGNIDVLGMISDETLITRLTHARALLFLSPYEGFGIPALEAMAAQVPVIAANRASLPEIVSDAGLLVNPDDISEILAALNQTIPDSPWRRELLNRGMARARTYTWHRCTQQLHHAFLRFS